MPIRLPSRLPAATEQIINSVIGGAISVHTTLGPGLLEAIYVDAMAIELEFRGLAFERERVVPLYYRNRPLRTQRLDLVVQREVLVEVKAVERLQLVHQSQVISYLKASGLRVGLLMNFNSNFLKDGLRRIVM
jgi:GxxExxY protein